MNKMVTRSYCIIALLLILPLNCREENTTDIFDIRDEYNAVKKYVAVILFSVFLLYGIVSNILLTIVFCSRDNLYGRSFLLIITQLIICNFLVFSLHVFALSGILRAKNSSDAHGESWFSDAFANIDTLLFIATLQFTFLLALSRLVTINLQKFNAFFESKKLQSLLVFVWLLAFAISIVKFHYCTSKYCFSTLSWERNCTKQSVEGGEIFMTFYRLWTTSLPIAMLVIYVAIFCGVRRKRHFASDINQKHGISRIFAEQETNTIKINSYERSTLIQAALICIAMEIEIIIFNFLPKFATKIFGEGANIPSRIFVNCSIISNCAVLPTVNFIYNKRARNIIKQQFSRLFFKGGNVQNTTTT